MSEEGSCLAPQTDYWFHRPSALFEFSCLKDVCPDFSDPAMGSKNVNRWTIIAIAVVLVLAILFRSLWPLVVGAAGLLLVLLISYGLDSYSLTANGKCCSKTVNELSSFNEWMQRNALVQQLSRNDEVVTSNDSNAKESDGGLVDTLSCAPCQKLNKSPPCPEYPECGPGGPLPCGTEFTDPRATIPHPSGHNSYDQVDARYRRYEIKPQPVTVEPAGDSGDGSCCGNTYESPSKNIPLGIDPRTANDTLAFNEIPDSYQGGGIGADERSIHNIYNRRPHQAMTQTEGILSKMYQDVNSYWWDTMVKDRAPRWQQNPNDPRTRRKMEQDAIERDSWRGFQILQS